MSGQQHKQPPEVLVLLVSVGKLIHAELVMPHTWKELGSYEGWNTNTKQLCAFQRHLAGSNRAHLESSKWGLTVKWQMDKMELLLIFDDEGRFECLKCSHCVPWQLCTAYCRVLFKLCPWLTCFNAEVTLLLVQCFVLLGLLWPVL